MTDPKILDRIKKLLALSTSSNANEAALALQRAQEMMAAHNVSEAVVELGVLTEMEITSIATATRVKTWELRLMQGIAEAFGLELLFRKRYPYAGYIFIGPTMDVQVAHYAATVLLRNLGRDRARFTNSLKDSGRRDWRTDEVIPLTRKEKSAEVDAFCGGWVKVALTKVTRLTRDPKHAAMIKAHVEQMVNPNAPAAKLQQNRGGSYAAHQAGTEAAEDVSLNRPMDGTANQTKQLGGR